MIEGNSLNIVRGANVRENDRNNHGDIKGQMEEVTLF
jgi:hypothetical protein